MAPDPLVQRIADALPVVGRLRRERNAATAETRRVLGILSEVMRRDRAFVVERNSLRLLLDPSSLVDRIVFASGEWEATQLDAMEAAARSFAGDRRRKLFLDIGAHWGLYALRLWRTGIFDEIHCFEPDPQNFAQLGAQIFLNDAAYDIALHRTAVADVSSVVRLRPASAIADGNRGAAALVADDEGIRVPAVAIDDIVDVRDAIVFAKIDVEGSEARVLAGMRRLLAANDVYLQVEALAGNEAALFAAMPQHVAFHTRCHCDFVFSTFAGLAPPDADP